MKRNKLDTTLSRKPLSAQQVARQIKELNAELERLLGSLPHSWYR
ncbi:hypothetical protein [Lacimicrobium sp. SS2-24]|nr:hypothetical protein [Lacimicrobium sp. SS2-24]